MREGDNTMAIDPKEINSIEDSMVHDEDPDPKPQGWGVYLTLKFISKTILGVYALMLLAMLALQLVIGGGQQIPVSLSPESLLVAIPFALVAIYFFFTADPEPELEKMHTTKGRLATFIGVFVVMQVVSVLLWVLIAKAFSLH
jgi:energy-coupling factor transporter transmembrane protein EcfT